MQHETQTRFTEDLSLMRTPPFSVEAEEGVIGGVLIRPDLLPEVLDCISGEEDFHTPACRRIFGAIFELYKRSEPIDMVTVSAQLGERVKMEVGGMTYLSALTDAAPVAMHAQRYAQIVADFATRRRIISTGLELKALGHQDGEPVDSLIDRAEKLVSGITQSSQSNIPYRHISDVVPESLAQIEAAHANGRSVTGIPTGFGKLDWYLAGLQPSDLIIVGGRPSMGKTAFAAHVGENSAERGYRVLFLSLEMSRAQIASRTLSRMSHINGQALRKGRVSDGWDDLLRAAEKASALPFWIDDTPALTVYQARSRARRLKAEHGLDLVIVDYLQLMHGSATKGETSREREISEISRSLKGLAKELSVPVIALSQLNRTVESRQDKRPMLSDLRESGAIEQDADVIMFIYRDEVYNKEKTDDPGVAEIIIGKQRNGPIGTIRLGFDRETSAFRDIEVLSREERG